MKGFDKYQGEDAVREALTAFFEECGEVSSVRLPSDRETGDLKGIAFVEFATNDAKVCLLPRSPVQGHKLVFVNPQYLLSCNFWVFQRLHGTNLCRGVFGC